MNDGRESLLDMDPIYADDTSVFGPTDTETSNIGTSTGRIETLDSSYETEGASNTSDEALSVFSAMVDHYLKTSAHGKHRVRSLIIDELQKRERLNERINKLLEQAVRASRPGRLDDAIDVLANEAVPFWEYASSECFQGLELRGEDEVYILLRVAGKRREWPLVALALEGALATTREAASEALCDIATSVAKRKLLELANNDPSSSVRKLAEERLDELDEA